MTIDLSTLKPGDAMTKFEDELREAFERMRYMIMTGGGEDWPGPDLRRFETLKQAAALLLDILPELRRLVWKPIEAAPKHQDILVFYMNELGKSRIVKAAYFTRMTLEASSEFYDAEYDEKQDNYFAPEGWYESLEEASNMLDFSYYRMTCQPELWMPIPSPALTEKLKKAGVV